MSLTRRALLTAGAGALAAGATAAYGRFLEPSGDLVIARHALTPVGWTPGLKLRVVALTDFHCGGAHMPVARIDEIVRRTHALEPDVIALLGDFVTEPHLNVYDLKPQQWARALGRLTAPLGVYAILGNHEYWDDPDVKRRKGGEPFGQKALLDVGLPVLKNQSVRLVKEGRPFHIAGIDSQIAFWVRYSPSRGGIFRGLDDLPAALALASDGAPVVLLAHEPDIFATLPRRDIRANLAVTLSGHTHGGQVQFLGWRPYVPSAYGDRYAHGHIVEAHRDLIVSAGLGTSGPPIRFGVPPEIVVVDLG